jgi:hypothetical protein
MTYDETSQVFGESPVVLGGVLASDPNVSGNVVGWTWEGVLVILTPMVE